MTGRPGGVTGPPGDMTGLPGDMTGPPGDMTGPPGDMTGPPADMTGPPGDMTGPPADGKVTRPPGDAAGPPGSVTGQWHRLHPLSPLVRSGRATVGVLAIVGISASGQFGPDGSHLYDWGLAVVAVVAAVVNWLVTRWKLDGATLRIETGLLRRDSRQLPVARIQAVDVVRPFLARALGLAELRVRLAGSSHADGRLSYLPEQAALELRARPAGRTSRARPGHPGTR